MSVKDSQPTEARPRGCGAMRLLQRLRRDRSPEPIAQLREGFATFVLRGDNVWGASITWADTPSEEKPNEGRVVGWTTPLPREGDRLLVKMVSGRWGWWVFTGVEYCRDPYDMFYGDVVGAFGYVDDGEVPAGVVSRQRTGTIADDLV